MGRRHRTRAARRASCRGVRRRRRDDPRPGRRPGGNGARGASVRKLVQTRPPAEGRQLGLELLGPEGALRERAGGRAVHGFLMSRCLTIAGGTTQVQLNVVAERILGLPRD
ncbi:acyl-CoA dehydrogenase family protein [Streptomyces sp. NPDC019890]|uniref:acyl-CoA dehydrogenase family protein n=1 Tax=Streptomyces sp. NPDC019890 TaxID=3365064 RepID=UPI00384C49FA